MNDGKILVTGASGFLGRALCNKLVSSGRDLCMAVRHIPDRLSALTLADGSACFCVVDEIGPATKWSIALAGVTEVIHLAARVHVMHDAAIDPYAEFYRINVAGTKRLALQAAKAGVRRLVYVSTIKVNGECTTGKPFRPDDKPQPGDAYAQSKLEAESVLEDISRNTGIEVVIVRPPLVYGPGVKGNFLSLLGIVQRGLPMPLANCDNRRSLVGLSNLVDLLTICTTHPAAAGQVFLAADGEDLSTPELLKRVARVFGSRARLFPFPVSWLRALARAVGRASAVERLCGSLQVDASKARSLLGWLPPLTVDDELARTVQWFREKSG
jgi:nucleoside-diphosphate-sugar epimerase